MIQRQFTATVFVFDALERVLLLHHRRLNVWMPPGGHVEENETPSQAAIRECKEETGVDVELLYAPLPNVFALHPEEGCMLPQPCMMLLEYIPACPERNEPAHEHIDHIFVGKPRDEGTDLTLAAAEAHDVRWWTEEELRSLPMQSIYGNVLAGIEVARQWKNQI